MQIANALDAQAQVLRDLASGIIASGCPVDVHWPRADSGNLSLHQLTSSDLLADAEALEADAVKLRLLYQ